jgi:hypothetical protein
MYIPIPLLPYFPKQFGKKGKSKDSYVFHASTQGESERWLQALRAAAYPDVVRERVCVVYIPLLCFAVLLFCHPHTRSHVSPHTESVNGSPMHMKTNPMKGILYNLLKPSFPIPKPH